MPAATRSGRSCAYADEGSGPAIVFGHGLLSDRGVHAAQVATLRDRHRCIALDWPGHGASAPAAGTWTLCDLAADTAALLDELGVTGAVLAGIGLGAMAFVRLALLRPELVRGLVLVGAGATAERWPLLAELEGRRDVLLHGGEAERSDGAVAPGSGPALAATIPGARLVPLDGAGHHAPAEAPAAVTRAVESLLGPPR